MTALCKTADEVGGMDFPAVVDLLDYWLEYPPTHVLVRGLAGYEGKGQGKRAKKAAEMGDTKYKPEKRPSMSDKDARIEKEVFTGTRHLDCAPPHVQQAIERAKKGEHFAIPEPE